MASHDPHEVESGRFESSTCDYKSKPNLNLVKIEAYHCYCCGESLTNTGHRQRTKHHAIPQQFRPIRNIIVPLCITCHRMIHQDIPEIKTPKLQNHIKAFVNYMDGIEAHVKRIKEAVKLND